MFVARNLLFYPGSESDNTTELSDEIIVPAYYINRLMDDFHDGEPLLINIINVDKNLKHLVAFGTSHNFDKSMIFVPQWVLDSIGHDGICDDVIKLEKVDTLDIPVATKIVIKPLDPVAFEIDTLEYFQKAMLNLHSIRIGMIIPILVPELGHDYRIMASIESVEPAELSRILESEIDVDFINEINKIVEPISDIQHTESTTTVSETSSIITEAASSSASAFPAPVEQITAEERRRRVVESWLKRFPNSAEQQ